MAFHGSVADPHVEGRIHGAAPTAPAALGWGCTHSMMEQHVLSNSITHRLFCFRELSFGSLQWTFLSQSCCSTTGPGSFPVVLEAAGKILVRKANTPGRPLLPALNFLLLLPAVSPLFYCLHSDRIMYLQVSPKHKKPKLNKLPPKPKKKPMKKEQTNKTAKPKWTPPPRNYQK